MDLSASDRCLKFTNAKQGGFVATQTYQRTLIRNNFFRHEQTSLIVPYFEKIRSISFRETPAAKSDTWTRWPDSPSHDEDLAPRPLNPSQVLMHSRNVSMNLRRSRRHWIRSMTTHDQSKLVKNKKWYLNKGKICSQCHFMQQWSEKWEDRFLVFLHVIVTRLFFVPILILMTCSFPSLLSFSNIYLSDVIFE